MPEPPNEDRELAQRIGQRIREARHRAGLTQQQLAGDRYTKAYVSALETGIARPSMVALNFHLRAAQPAGQPLHRRGPPGLDAARGRHAARGRGVAAACRRLSERSWPTSTTTACAPISCAGWRRRRLDSTRARKPSRRPRKPRGSYAAAGRDTDAALARYWLAYGLYQSDNEPDARSLLTALLEQVRDGLHVEPDFEMRLLTSLAAVESRAGQPTRALTYLEEARGLAADLDDRRRAAFLFNLAINYREVGDFEAAIRAGTQGMALYRAAGAIFESARIENDLALAYLATGQIERARELASDARDQIEETGDERWMAAVADTEAQVALAAGEMDGALRLAQAARGLRRPQRQRVRRPDGDAHRGARMLRRAGRATEAETRFGEAAAIARASRAPNRLREVLREWADLRAEAGDHRGAYELSSEALTVN